MHKIFVLLLGYILLLVADGSAKLSSTATQESRMIKIAVLVGERWNAKLADDFRRNEFYLEEAALQRKEIGTYETAIFEDMSIATEIASMLVYSMNVNFTGVRAIDGFDTAAERLSNNDQLRYYCAKAHIHGDLLKSGQGPDTFAILMEKLVTDYCRAAENGYDAQKAVAAVARQIENAGYNKLNLDQYTCRIYQAHLPYVAIKIKELHAARKDRDGFDLAVRTMREMPPTMGVKPGSCGTGSSPESIQFYGNYFIAPACKYLGTYGDELLIETCREYWDTKPLVAVLLPRVKSASHDAFDLFKKAGEDNVLKSSGAIAWAELSIWKKAGKLREFKKLYPARYQLGMPAWKKRKDPALIIPARTRIIHEFTKRSQRKAPVFLRKHPMQQTNKRMPVLFVGHGNPMNAIEDTAFSMEWQKLGSTLPRPKAILCISAHWESKGSYVTAMEKPRTIHDFGGFPQELYDVNYPAPGSLWLAQQVKDAVSRTTIEFDSSWGLDHGTWSVLKRMYPKADVPVVQLCLNRSGPNRIHYDLGKELAELRSKGVLIIGSGNIVHNLQMATFRGDDFNAPFGFDWAIEANELFKKLIIEDRHDELVAYESLGKSARLAISTAEHYLPMLYIIALRQNDETVSFFNDVPVAGSLTMTSFIIQ